MALLPFGVEWSAQFCADPLKIEVVRQYAERLVAGFPLTVPGYRELGMTDADLAILTTPITDAAGVALWTDSFWNASVPLPASKHTGVLPKAAGLHHYPAPVAAIDFFKRDDFTLWVSDGAGNPVAVAPVAPRGSGAGEVQVLYAAPSTALGKAHHVAHHAGKALVLPADSPEARAAFRRQQ